MHSTLFLCAALATLVTAGAPVGAQDRSTTPIAETAIKHLIEEGEFSEAFENGTVLLDVSALNSSEERDATAQHLGLARADTDAVHQCEERGRPSTCRLEGADFLVTLLEQRAGNETATVIVEVRGEVEGHKRQPVWLNGFQIDLKLEEGRWVAVGLRTLYQT